MSEQARIALTIRGNTIEISGPEHFVTAQVEAFRAAILSALNGAADAPKEKPPAEKQSHPADPHHKQTGKQTYPNVLHIEADKVQILKKVPGNTKSKKALNTALVYSGLNVTLALSLFLFRKYAKHARTKVA